MKNTAGTEYRRSNNLVLPEAAGVNNKTDKSTFYRSVTSQPLKSEPSVADLPGNVVEKWRKHLQLQLPF